MYNEEEVFNFLLSLQLNGESYFVPHLKSKFGMTSSEASSWIGNWINSFNKPICKDCE